VVLQRAEGDDEPDITGQTLQIFATAPHVTGCLPVKPKAPTSASLSTRRHSILCLYGQVELELDGQNYCLNPGDSLAFNSDAFHRWRNAGQSTGIAVLILPPVEFGTSQTGN